jgi:hypothetical protein
MKVSTKPKCPKELKDTINALSKDLRKALKADYGVESTREQFFFAVKSIQRKWGLYRKQTRSVSNAVFISKKYGVVVKLPYYDGTSVPKCAIYTVRINYSTDECAVPAIIQPLADRTSLKAVYEAFRSINAFLRGVEEFSGYDDGITNDQHHNNVGVFMGEAVSIDW